MPWRHDVMTLCHDVTKPDFPNSACRCARKLIFLFPWFFRSLSSKMLIIFHSCDAVTSWRHAMMSLNLIHLSQLVDVLERWFFFCFHDFLGHWVWRCYYFFVCVMPWRHAMTSLNLIHASQLVDVLESWFFLFPWFSRSLSSKILMISHLCNFVTTCRHVVTSQKLLNLPQVMNLLEWWSCSRFHGFSGCVFLKC